MLTRTALKTLSQRAAAAVARPSASFGFGFEFGAAPTTTNATTRRTMATATKIDGKQIAKDLTDSIRPHSDAILEKFGRKPGLAVVLVGDRPDSATYVNMKKKMAKSVGFNSVERVLPDDVSQEELLSTVQALNDDDAIDGILVQVSPVTVSIICLGFVIVWNNKKLLYRYFVIVSAAAAAAAAAACAFPQLPLPEHLEQKEILLSISPEKDVDGFHPYNMGALVRCGEELRQARKVRLGFDCFPSLSVCANNVKKFSKHGCAKSNVIFSCWF